MTKMTSKMALTYAIDNCDLPQDVMEKFIAMRAQLDKNTSAERKPTPRQNENAVLMNDILVALSDGRHCTVSDLIANVPSLVGLTPQRVSALMRLLKLDGKVDKETVKGKTLFFLI